MKYKKRASNKSGLNFIKKLFSSNFFIVNYREKLIIKRLNLSIKKFEEDYELYKKYFVNEKVNRIEEILKELKYIKTGKE